MLYNSLVLSIATFVYGLAGALYLSAWVFRKQAPGRIATGVTVLAVLGNLAGLILRWVESYSVGYGHAPLTNLYESLTFFALVIGVIYLVIEWLYKNRRIGAVTMPLICLALAYAALKVPGKDIQPLIPALQSNWLIAHVVTCFIGYAAFAIAFAVSIMYLFQNRRQTGGKQNQGRKPADGTPRMELDELIYQLSMFGFLFLTVGIITGAVWANSAWGRYWGWDPKETWSLITWFVYAALLHARMMRGWHGKRIAVLSVLGFAAVLFTYFGVNLLPGMHSYGAFN
jgi:cytochrome c-type biogenesis protein CcsB